MPRRKIKISSTLLRELYVRKKLPMYRIARRFGCCWQTVSARLKDYDLGPEGNVWKIKYQKTNFSGNEVEKSYILGFRVGDLDVRMPCKSSSIIIARCHTTKKHQVKIIKEIFSPYGRVVVSKSRSPSDKPSLFAVCNLNRSFSFLLIKKPYSIDYWIDKKFVNSVSFMAGYVDAEANFILNQRKARFKIDSYDINVLRWMYQKFGRWGIRSKLRIIGKKGSMGYNGVKWRNDLWRLNINEAFSLITFCSLILPFMRHKKRTEDVLKCISNIVKRKKDGTI